MANTVEYKKKILQHVLDKLDNSNSGLNYQVTEFWSQPTPQALYEFIKGRLGTMDGTVFCRIGESQFTPIDTIAQLYEVDIELEVICASDRVIREDQLAQQSRHTDEMIVKVRNEILQNPITLNGRPQRWIIGRDTSLFRDAAAGADAQLLTMEIENLTVEF